MPDGIDHYHHHYHHYHHHYHHHHHNKDSHLLLRLHRRRQKRKRRRCGSRKCVDAEAEIIIIIIIILSPTSTPRFPSDALGGLVVVGVPPLSAFLSPPRPLRCRSVFFLFAAAFYVFLRPSTDGASAGKEPFGRLLSFDPANLR